METDNAKMLDFIHEYSNQQVKRAELMGTELMGVDLLRKYKKSKCLVDNDGEIMTDLQRLFCKNMCFFDPKLYGHCPYDHDGDISIFNNNTYLGVTSKKKTVYLKTFSKLRLTRSLLP